MLKWIRINRVFFWYLFCWLSYLSFPLILYIFSYLLGIHPLETSDVIMLCIVFYIVVIPLVNLSFNLCFCGQNEKMENDQVKINFIFNKFSYVKNIFKLIFGLLWLGIVNLWWTKMSVVYGVNSHDDNSSIAILETLFNIFKNTVFKNIWASLFSFIIVPMYFNKFILDLFGVLFDKERFICHLDKMFYKKRNGYWYKP